MDTYFSNLLQFLNLRDLLISIIKSVAFGAVISIGATLQGFSFERAITEVPVAGLKAVGSAFGLCIVVDILLSALYYIVA
jgi:phospholipid/cholesterol/gamma-HCH transport system permease protein